MEWIEICNKLTLGFPAKRKNHFSKISRFPRNFFCDHFTFFLHFVRSQKIRKFSLYSLQFVLRNRKWENFARISENFAKNGNYAKKKRILRKIQNFQKPLQQNFSEKVAKIHQKRLNFENKRLIFKERFIHEHNCRLAQKINKDSRTTGIHYTFHENIRILYFCFIYFREKTCKMWPTIFAFFVRNVSFAENPNPSSILK